MDLGIATASEIQLRVVITDWGLLRIINGDEMDPGSDSGAYRDVC